VRLSGHKSMTFRLTMLFALSSTVVLLLLGYLIAGSLERHFEEQDMEVLTGKLKLAQHALEKVRSAVDLEVLTQQLDDSLVGHHGLELVVVAPEGQILFATSGAEFPQSLLDSRVWVASARPTVWTTGISSRCVGFPPWPERGSRTLNRSSWPSPPTFHTTSIS
jgi:two-component system heavy metal sensor histidine kinase CusS